MDHERRFFLLSDRDQSYVDVGQGWPWSIHGPSGLLGMSPFIDTVILILTQKELDLFCATYNIQTNLHPELPGRGDTIKNSLKGKKDTNGEEIEEFFVEKQRRLVVQSSYRLQPPCQGLLNFVKSADPFKIKVGERTLVKGEVPLTETADMVVVPSDQTMRLVDHTIIDEIKEHSRKNKRKRNPLASDNLVDFPLREKLNLNRPLIRRYLEEFLCIVGLNRSFVVVDACPTLLGPDKNGGCWFPRLLNFVKSADPQADVGSRCAASHAKEFVSSCVTPTSDRGDHEDSGSTHDENIQTRHASEHYVVLTFNYGHEDANIVVSPSASIPRNGDGSVSGLELVCDGLKNKAAKVEVNCESLRGEVAGETKMNEDLASMQDATARRFDELDACIVKLNHDMDVGLYPYMPTAIARQRLVIGHGFCLAVMKCAQSIKSHATLGKVISMAINKGDHGNEDPTPKFHKLQPISAQVTMHVYFEYGISKGPDSISHEILLSDVIAASHTHSKEHKKAHLQIGCLSVVTPSLSSQEASLCCCGSSGFKHG
nr:hypothetical protein [Tanacetum cinerariifolium]